MAEEVAKMVIGNMSEKARLLKHVHSEARKLKYDVESLQSFELQSSSGGGDQVSKICVKRAREAVYDVLDDYQLHFDDEESGGCGGGVFGLPRKMAWGIEIASEIREVRDEIRDVKILEKRRRGEGSNNLNIGNSNRASDPGLDALFVHESDLAGIDLPRRELIQMLCAKEEGLSVVGMGGLGKITLVKKVYEQTKRGVLNPSHQFETFAWIPVSQTYKATHLLGRMIAQFDKAKRDTDLEVEIDLIDMTRSHLENKRFLLVLDDMWHLDAWTSLKRALPDCKNRSRVILTTRIEDVANFCSNKIFHLQPLAPSKAWSLFCRKAFRSNNRRNCYPPGLKQLAYSFVKKCRGLPLAIVSLSSLLSVKPHAEWDMIHWSLGAELETDDRLKSMKNILLLSFHDLPHHLKSCFLFLNIFPEDYYIKRMKLIRLWIAEGLVQSQRRRSLEEVADGYLKQLIQRSLVQVAQWKLFDNVETCLLHDIVREIFIPEYEKEGFFSSSSSSMELEKMAPSNSMLRRLSIYSSKGDETFQRYEKLARLRSLFIFSVDNALPAIASLAKMRWLRVLDIENAPLEEFPDELTHLPHLRYLRLENTKIKVLPDTVRKLKRLETLNLKGSLIRELPAGILQLQHLQHLLVYKYGQGEFPFQSTGGIRAPAGIGKLKSLQKLRSLFIFAADNVLPAIASMAKMRWLRVVDIENAPLEEFPDELTHMPHLRYLSLINTKIKTLPDTVGKLKRLETLNLKGSLFRELTAAILVLQHLRHLLVYKYLQGEYPFQSTGGIRMPARIGKLRCLQKLAHVDAESGVVAELENLTELRRLCVIKLRREDGTHLCNSVAKMRQLQALDVKSVDENELLDIQSLSSTPLSLQRLYIYGRLENVPHWIPSLHNLVDLRLFWCKLKDDPLKALQSLPSLVSLELRNAYDGEELCCEAAGGYPRLKQLSLEDLISLKGAKVENGAMSNLVAFRVLVCKQFEDVPLWLQHIPTMKLLHVFGVPEKFKQSMYKRRRTITC